jgi:hypothetical protein
MIQVRSFEKLEKVLLDNIAATTPVICGSAGIGKSVFVEKFGKEKYDMIITKRLSGITDEMLVGIPEMSLCKTFFSFIKMDFVAQIQRNKDKKILLFLDELNRTPERLRPALFSLLEKNIEGEYYPNLHIISAINLGDQFENNWDVGADKALLSRMVLVDFHPDRKYSMEYMEKSGYNKILINILSRLDKLFNEELGESPTEQTTNGRTWFKLNNAFEVNEVKDIKKASEIILDYGLGYMNKVVYHKLSNIAQQMIRAESSIDIPKILKEGILPKKDVSEFELLLSISDYVSDKDNQTISLLYLDNAVSLLSTKKEVLVNTLQKMYAREILQPQIFSGVVRNLDKESKSVLLKILQ